MSNIPCNCDGCVRNAPVAKKKIAVIGAGASGLTVMKEMTALGHKVITRHIWNYLQLRWW